MTAEDAAWTAIDAAAAEARSGARVVRYGDHSDHPGHPDQIAEVHGSGPAIVVLLHGGYFRPSIDRTHARGLAADLAAATGHQVWLAEYRRVPGDPEATLDDLRALDRAAGAAGDVIAWAGHSAGGTLALWRACAADLGPVPVVALAPVVDLRRAAEDRLGDGAVVDWMGGTPAEVPAHYAVADPLPRLRAGAADRPGGGVTVLHGDRDATVPVSQSTALTDPPAPGVRVEVLAGAHHFDAFDLRTAAGAALVAALRPRGSSDRRP
ncbi:alpha/beta hydrolase fold domain-containing protein [Nocardioides sp. WV_118_6]|uniref:alpha/beta hydrolase fold domain-containing protein n=1 Tax=Nocardioides simplex TaxID=2045 RepID=UPI00214FD039|nr:alpha/beta hydrolase fold domain-containing protein [Pimelobacter simplex]UUW88178.1 alpha/beta hydrolase fold domain-containing protein [Pimelobacter simplex]UUW97683.1 alpha/beta hydrolase fold domain-containing protein [Pimelobacter simplex]